MFTANNELWKPCEGISAETINNCLRTCVKSIVCVLSPWSARTECDLMRTYLHKNHERKMKQYPENVGTQCDCDIGWQTRYRRITQHGKHGGSTCSTEGQLAPLQELQNCSFNPCPLLQTVKDCGGPGISARVRSMHNFARISAV